MCNKHVTEELEESPVHMCERRSGADDNRH